MSEYWKSTPKYWCKFCKTYVRDTKLDKQQHDATPRHQGNIQRSLRTLHREHEREDRDKQRAKDEVARLNGIVAGGGKASGSSASSSTRLIAPPVAVPRQASAEDRKKQIQQLVDLGVEVPREYRADFAVAGHWETTGQRRIDEVKDEEDSKDALSFGVRKRKYEGAEEEEEAGETVVRKGWGSTLRRYPGEDREGEDIEALFKGKALESRNAEPTGAAPLTKKEESVGENVGGEAGGDVQTIPIKSEDGDSEAVAATTGIVFKKRKAKVAKAT